MVSTNDADIHTAIGESVLRSMLRRYEHLNPKWSTFEEGAYEFEIAVPKQAGLNFDMILAHADDTFFLGAGGFWMEYFPCDILERVERYEAAVDGILSGRFRILELYRESTVIKAELQQPSNGGWQTIATYRRGFPMPFRRYETRVLQRQNPRADV